MRRALEPPGPGPQAQPVDRAARPDPQQPTAVDLDLGDALHAGPQGLCRMLEAGLDAEEVAAILRRGDRGDAFHREGKGIARQRRKAEIDGLAGLYVGDVALVDFEDGSVAIERRHLEQQLALLHGRTEELAVLTAFPFFQSWYPLVENPGLLYPMATYSRESGT